MAVVTLLGTGHMGAPIGHRLLAAGHRLTAWNRTGARAAAPDLSTITAPRERS